MVPLKGYISGIYNVISDANSYLWGLAVAFLLFMQLIKETDVYTIISISQGNLKY